MKRREKGVTLVILIVTVMTLMIIAGVIVSVGLNSIKNAEKESLKTNMLLIQAKGKEYVENANYHYGPEEITDEQKKEIKQQYLKGTYVENEDETANADLTDSEEAYKLSSSDMVDMGLNELSETAEDYFIIYDVENESVDVMYKPGIVYDEQRYYTLSSMEKDGI